jgi:predicted nucleic acid-binding protein
MARILWDTNLFIYLFEENSQFSARVISIRKSMNARHDQLYATAMTVGEILVQPVSRGDFALQEKYERFFRSGAVTVLAFDLDASGHYARIRQDRSIRPPDAIQLACGAAHGVDLFITNDDRLSGKAIPSLGFVTSLQQAPL